MALVKFSNGTRAIVSGNENGIAFGKGEVEFIYGHSHPTNAPSSTEDYQSLQDLDQSQQTIITPEGVFKIRKVVADENGELTTPTGDKLVVNNEGPVVVKSGPPDDAKINQLSDELIADSNTGFPLTKTNAKKIITELAPSGYYAESVAGPGVEGGDVTFKNADGKVYKIEVKCVDGFNGFNNEVAKASQKQATGNLVVFQVKTGTDPSKWLARFWGNRQPLITSEIPADIAKMDAYKTTDVIILDESGSILLPKQKIYNPQ